MASFLKISTTLFFQNRQYDTTIFTEYLYICKILLKYKYAILFELAYGGVYPRLVWGFLGNFSENSIFYEILELFCPHSKITRRHFFVDFCSQKLFSALSLRLLKKKEFQVEYLEIVDTRIF